MKLSRMDCSVSLLSYYSLILGNNVLSRKYSPVTRHNFRGEISKN